MDEKADTARAAMDRRNFMTAAGKFALVTPPAMTMLLSTSLSSPAIAASGIGGGYGGASGDGGGSETKGGAGGGVGLPGGDGRPGDNGKHLGWWKNWSGRWWGSWQNRLG